MNLKTSQAPRLVRIAGGAELFFVVGNLRRRVLHPDVAGYIREVYPQITLVEAPRNEVLALDPGAHVPRAWTDDEWIEPPQIKQMMREIIVSRLRGHGLEFGAGSRPLPLPLHTDVDYAEPFQSAEQYARMGYNDNTVRARYKNPIENQHEVADGSLDFIVAAHVIEHTPNPIGAIVESFKKLKTGGYLVLIVPDRRRTFDKYRDLTPLEHLVLDYEKPDRARDLENYIDFFRKAKRSKTPESDAAKAHADGIDIHYHVWEPGSFSRMMRAIVDNYAPFRSVELKPPVEDDTCLEFYMVAQK